MAGDGMDVDLDDLRLMVERLNSFKTEFADLGRNTGAVADAVARPAGRSELRGRVEDFESGWDGNREVIAEDLDAVYQHLKGFVETIGELDVEMAGDGG